MDDFIRCFVLDNGFVVYLVGKIRLFIYDEVGSYGEKIRTSGIVENERWDIGYPGFCSTGVFNVSGVVTVDSGLEGRVYCVDSGDSKNTPSDSPLVMGREHCFLSLIRRSLLFPSLVRRGEGRYIIYYGILEDSGYLVL